MASVARSIITVNDTQFVLTTKQLEFLKKKSFKASDNWRVISTEKALLNRKLFKRLNGSLVRTKLGDEVLSRISTKLRKAAKESAK